MGLGPFLVLAKVPRLPGVGSGRGFFGNAEGRTAPNPM